MESVSVSLSIFDKKTCMLQALELTHTQGLQYVVGLIPTHYFRILPYLASNEFNSSSLQLGN